MNLKLLFHKWSVSVPLIQISVYTIVITITRNKLWRNRLKPCYSILINYSRSYNWKFPQMTKQKIKRKKEEIKLAWTPQAHHTVPTSIHIKTKRHTHEASDLQLPYIVSSLIHQNRIGRQQHLGSIIHKKLASINRSLIHTNPSSRSRERPYLDRWKERETSSGPLDRGSRENRWGIVK